MPQLLDITKKMRWLGIVGLFSMIASQPDILGLVPAFVASLISVIATYWALYLLDKRYGGLNLFKISVYQLLIFVSLALVVLITIPRVVGGTSMNYFYILLGIMMLLLFFIAYSNYKMSKKLTEIAELSGNNFFRYSAILLLISAYTMPIIIGLVIFAVAIVLFLVGCMLYKENNPTSQPVV